MVTARFYRENGRYSGFYVSGHAGYDDYGRDIVCASITSAVQTVANTITEIISVNADVKAENDVVELNLPSGLPQEKAYACDAVLKGLYMQCSELSKQFPGFVSVKILEE